MIAHELREQLRGNVTVDWHQRESARARMRVLVKRILKKYGYPPDLADEAVQTVLAQAEILLKEIAWGSAHRKDQQNDVALSFSMVVWAIFCP